MPTFLLLFGLLASQITSAQDKAISKNEFLQELKFERFSNPEGLSRIHGLPAIQLDKPSEFQALKRQLLSTTSIHSEINWKVTAISEMDPHHGNFYIVRSGNFFPVFIVELLAGKLAQ